MGGGSSSWGSFLGTAAATAAGIAGGAFLFQGLESLLGHHDSGSGFLDSAGAGHAFNESYDTDDNEPGGSFKDDDYASPEEGFDAYDDDDDDGLSV
jgi:hypothetical protein